MGSYKLTDEAEADLIRIHQWGVRHHGEEQADRYFAAFFDHFGKSWPLSDGKMQSNGFDCLSNIRGLRSNGTAPTRQHSEGQSLNKRQR